MKSLGRGFTLIEVLVVIVIMFILFGMIAFATGGVRSSARDDRRKADVSKITSGLEHYRSDCGKYPLSLGTNLKGDGSTPSCRTDNVYLVETPLDPQTGTRDYSYNQTSDGYVLCASLENSSGAAISGCGSCGGTCNFAVSKP